MTRTDCAEYGACSYGKSCPDLCQVFKRKADDQTFVAADTDRFLEMFEEVHKTICSKGAAQISEYDEIWHWYKDKIRPLRLKT